MRSIHIITNPTPGPATSGAYVALTVAEAGRPFGALVTTVTSNAAKP